MNRRDGQQHTHKRGDVGLSVVAASRGTVRHLGRDHFLPNVALHHAQRVST